ncbi:hypothetical protein PoB_000255300 [Plakobranchus ocellatus]|uniref:Uncharacterized protein n=1 Tax=Plakobranchus ocellatus TaxID=259542 RepID=A0AAV3Y128_9GAST|nr:hypothetical protein PoB_000255300 [Plakobranchus ocellatus]
MSEIVQCWSVTSPHIQRFLAGDFVARKTKRAFSAIALNQAREQCSALVKGEGGVVGVTNNPSALRRWMAAGGVKNGGGVQKASSQRRTK